jgi:hypothetical protein
MPRHINNIRTNNVLLFIDGLTVIEHGWLRIEIEERRRLSTNDTASQWFRVRYIFPSFRSSHLRIAISKRIGIIVRFSFWNSAGHDTISLRIVDRCQRSVDRDLSKVVRTQTVYLSIQVTEETALEKRVIRDIDTYFK